MELIEACILFLRLMSVVTISCRVHTQGVCSHCSVSSSTVSDRQSISTGTSWATCLAHDCHKDGSVCYDILIHFDAPEQLAKAFHEYYDRKASKD